MNQIDLAKHIILEPAGITDHQLEIVAGKLLGKHIDDGDLYFQTHWSESWVLEDGIIKNGSFNIERGVGIRAISGEKTGLAYSEDIVMPALLDAASAAKRVATLGGEGVLAIKSTAPRPSLYLAHNPLTAMEDAEKIALLMEVNELAKKDPRIKKVSASLLASYDVVMIINAQGQLSADIRPLVRLNVSVVAEQNGRREEAYCGGGGRVDYHHFTKHHLVEQYVDEAVRLALLTLEAIPAPAGIMPVVLGSGWPGVLLHEAIGHGLEGDFNRKGTSAFSGRIGERVASSLCTVVDDGTLHERRGSLNIDDEGTPTQRTVLIENGILKGYLQDKLNAKLMNSVPTGNGRRESYAHCPMPRMTNTYMLAGAHDPAEMIAKVKKGLYAVNFDGGQVDITSGKFVFSTSEAYLIENGKITTPVKKATLIGSGPEVLTKVSMVGNDLKFDRGVGTCGKDGQSVPVGVGLPTILIDDMTVGGTQID